MSKLKSEENLRKWSEETNSQSSAFRFFNVAGGFAGGIPESLGSNLIPRIFQCISTGQEIEIYGNDWSTPDGFAIRDYVHIRDIVDAILISISNLERSNLNRGMFEVMNLGTGNGYSVMEVIDAIGRLNLGKIRHRIRPRRVGEVGFAVSNPTYGYHLMGIKCARDLNEMVQDYAELLRNT
jgi:UDP-glucose 4-epimerase